VLLYFLQNLPIRNSHKLGQSVMYSV